MTFLDDLKESREPFAIVSGHIYEIHMSNTEPSNYLCLKGKKFPLLKSESIDKLYEDIKREKKCLIKEGIPNEIAKKEIPELTREIITLENLIKNKDSISEKRFILRDVFQAYLSKYTGSATDQEKMSLILDKPNDISFKEPEITLKEFDDIFFCSDSVFKLRKASRESTEFLVIENKRYTFDFFCSYKDYLTLFNSYLKQHIKKQVVAGSERIIQCVSELNLKKERLEELKRSFYMPRRKYVKDHINNTMIYVGTVSDWNGRKRFELCLDLDPFMIERNSERFLFDSVTLSSHIEFLDDTVRITGRPRIKRDCTYNHPFVYEDNSICYSNGNGDRFENEGVTFNFVPYKEDRLFAASNIATSLNIARKILQMGYRGNFLSPVKILMQNNFETEYNNALANRDKVKVHNNDTRNI
jgi:hypothetical protein